MKETMAPPAKKTAKAAKSSGLSSDLHPQLSLREGIDRAFEEFFQGFSLPRLHSGLFEHAPFKRLGTAFGEDFPRIDMSEMNKQIEIAAEFEKGVLKILLPKAHRAAPKGKTIQIKRK